MIVNVFSNFRDAAESKINNHVLVMLDVLRASTTILEAIEMGADRVIPVTTTEEAVALKRARGGNTILAGERDGKPIDGFDLGNSPIEFTHARVKGKTIVMATSNGTKAIKCAEHCDTVLIGALRNRAGLCKVLREIDRPTTLICAGTDGHFSADDIYGAGAVINGLRALNIDIDLDDMGIVAEQFYIAARKNRELLAQCSHYQALKNLGYSDDLDFCFEEDVSEIIPRYSHLQITRMR